MVVRAHPALSLSWQCRLLSIGQSSLHYEPKGERPVDTMDKPLRALPTSPQAQQQQQEDGFKGILAA